MNNWQILKRNGERVAYDGEKIEIAVQKALASVGRQSPVTASQIRQSVETELEAKYIINNIQVGVEMIQDEVEKALMRAEEYETARAYIIYREAHKNVREIEKQTVQEEIMRHEFKILNDAGLPEIYAEEKISHKLETLAEGLPHIEANLVLSEVRKNLFENIRISELKKSVINAAVALIERHYDYSVLASRLLWDNLYEAVLGLDYDKKLLGKDLAEDKYKQGFIDYITKGQQFELLSDELSGFDLRKLADALKMSRDGQMYYLGAQTIYDRYLLKTPSKPRSVFELPQWMWMRIAMGLAIRENDKDRRAIEFYEVISRFLLVPSTPTLFNSGTKHSQLSSCYLATVDDSLTGIFKAFSDTAALSKWSGGVGTDWTPVRATGAKIKGTNGDSQGIIPFIKIYNDIAVAVNQGGKRRGALAAYLEVWHKDIEEFLELKKNTGDERRRAHDIHPACWIPDLFMKRVVENQKWTLFTPDEAPGLHNVYGQEFEKKYVEYEQANLYGAKQINARDLWKKMLTMLFETGHPWITFKDPSNIRSPQDHVGVVHNSNLCTEITLNNSSDEVAVCNLASLNLAKMIDENGLNKNLLEATLKTGMRMLDNVIDINLYTIPETKNANDRHRPVGLGVMGYQDALYLLDIDFASDENLRFADESMELISYYAISASSDLALERGPYSTYDGSKWSRGLLPADTLELLERDRGIPLALDKRKSMDWSALKEKIKRQGMRNSNCMAIAPTATISNIAGCIPCVEPIFKNIYTKENMSGNFLVVNRYLVDDLSALNLWNKQMLDLIKYHNGSIANIDAIPQRLRDKYKETFEIDPYWIVNAAAHRGKWIDQSASTNIFISTTSGQALSDLYIHAWKTGLKTTYYLRTLAASQIAKTTEAPEPPKITVPPAPAVKACLISNPDCEACQ